MKYIDLLNKYLPLAEAKGLEIDAVKFLISEISGLNQTEIYLHYDDEIDKNLEKTMIASVEKYLTGYPAQYILGYTYFYGLKLKVNKDVLIPRFDTECVVDACLELAKKYSKPKILDICTGSGAIAIALAKNGCENVSALDISKDALEVAKENAAEHKLKINFFESDLLRNVKEKYDILVSNPPYIPNDASNVDKLVLDNEPHIALFGGVDGLDFYRDILNDAKNYLNDNGVIIFEIPFDKAEELKALALRYFGSAIVKKDLAGNDRIMIIS